jgi:hypothetical protein
MTNDLFQLNRILDDIDKQIAELAGLGQDGFKVPLVTIPDELTEIVGLSMGSWRPLSNDLLWFYALKIAICAGEMLEQSGRIFQQIGEDESAQRAQNVVKALDEQFHPCETALQIFDRLLHSSMRNNTNGRSSSR